MDKKIRRRKGLEAEMHHTKPGIWRETVLNISSDVKAIRAKLDLSQAAFAALLNINIKTLQDWEQGRRKPRGPALSLLNIANNHPKVFKRPA